MPFILIPPPTHISTHTCTLPIHILISHLHPYSDHTSTHTHITPPPILVSHLHPYLYNTYTHTHTSLPLTLAFTSMICGLKYLYTYLYLFDIVEHQSSMFVPLPAYQTGKTAEAREDVAGDSKQIRARGSNTEYFVLCLLQPSFCVSL